MVHFFAYQILPLALLWLAFTALARLPSFARWGVPAVFAAGALLQFLAWLNARPDLENPDSLGYFRLAHHLEPDLRAILFRPKLYPVFLGLFHGLKAAVFWQSVFKLGMAGFLIRFAVLCGWKPATTAFTLFLFLFHSLWLIESLRIFDTALFGFLFIAYLGMAVEVLARYSPMKFAALCAMGGLVALTRQAADPSLLLVLLVVLANALYRAIVGTLGNRPAAEAEVEGAKGAKGAEDAEDAEDAERFRKPAVPGKRKPGSGPLLLPIGFSLALGLLIAGAGAIHNGIRYGVYQRSVALGINLYTHASYYQLGDPASPEWDFVQRYLPGARLRYPHWETDWKYDMPWSVNALPHRLERKLGSAGGPEIVGADRLLRDRAVAWAQGNPGGYLASVLNEAARLLSKCEETYPVSLLDPGGKGSMLIRRLERGLLYQPLWLLLVAGLAAWLFCPRNRWLLIAPGLAAVSYLALVAAVQIGLTRYALPAYLPLLMVAGQAVDLLPVPGAGTPR
ncbi:MAG: hypothetical protein ABIW76_23420 [Fibrobacteria bacterium]